MSSFDDMVGVTESLGITALSEKQRPWQEKWQEVGAAYEALSELHGDSAPGGSEHWKAIASTFFLCLPRTAGRHRERRHHTGDDYAQNPESCTAPCCPQAGADVDNTRKHGGRDQDKYHARRRDLLGEDHTPTMVILCECPNSSVEHIDVRDAAGAAAEAWGRDPLSAQPRPIAKLTTDEGTPECLPRV